MASRILPLSRPDILQPALLFQTPHSRAARGFAHAVGGGIPRPPAPLQRGCSWWHPLHKGGWHPHRDQLPPAMPPCIRLQPPGVHRDARHFALLLGPQRRCHAHRYRNAKLCQLFGEAAALGGAAEHDRLHLRYPRGVTIRPERARVLLLPIYTVVNISTGVFSSSASVSTGRSGPRGQCCAQGRRRYHPPCRLRAGCALPFAGSPACPWRKDYRVQRRISLRGAGQPLFDDLPRGKPVGKGDHAESWASGAPSTAPPLRAAVRPGTTSTATSG